MTSLGEKIRELRVAKKLSQPELAEAIGIEQSYLSKLENDKSVPSNEIFRALLSALEISLHDFMEAISMNGNQQKLLQIADIEGWYKAKQRHRVHSQRVFLYICSIMIVLGVTVFYAGFSKKIFNETQFEYWSQGIVLEGEPDNVFDSWRRLLDGNDRDIMRERGLEMERRKSLKRILLLQFKGSEFTEVSGSGKRLYSLEKEYQIPRAINSWLESIGVFFFGLGFVGFFLERKIYRL
ncbi:helix-turn-helix domain-containing protein [Shewanella sp. AS16]|uniref:helix-turn-helix domain-containing protein n=1 Tax=Shewanella sp. AS16 TaxID=2907625 RepID=UPI001F3945A3|nr:helix-turn-helix transcriptional regulator [Shewanella sp. AS16]MCE9685885.1 helix-turn-helix domain-containing protein [Shewanella sp. AS16]